MEENRSQTAGLSPEEAIDRLEELHSTACMSLRTALRRYVEEGVAPSSEERRSFRYPELKVTWKPSGRPKFTRRAWAKFQVPGVYTTTVTHPAAFRTYLLEQLHPLVDDYGAIIEVGVSEQEIPYPYVTESDDAFLHGEIQVADIALHFPTPVLANVGDEVVDGNWEFQPGKPRPLSLFDAVRTDFSLKRLTHYTGSAWQRIQPWILLTNYQRYVDQFVEHGLQELGQEGSPYTALCLPSGECVSRHETMNEARLMIARCRWERFQMPAYSLLRQDGQGLTIINIGVGPSNAKNITDHLAVLRPNCWLMVGHCGGLRQTQAIGDYVLAHGYLRRDKILDDLLPTEIPVPALAEVQTALQEAAARVTGDSGDALKRRLRTGTVVTYDDRNWDSSGRRSAAASTWLAPWR